MGLVRCKEHPPEKQTKYHYLPVNAKKPEGFPEVKVLICGLQDCLNPASLVWLNEIEAKDYNKGIKIFSTKTSTVGGKQTQTGAKVMVQ